MASKSTDNTTEASRFADAAEQFFSDKRAWVTAIGAAQDEINTAEDARAELDARYKRDCEKFDAAIDAARETFIQKYNEAVRDGGWKSTELRKMGIVKPRENRKKSAKSAAKTAQSTPAEGDGQEQPSGGQSHDAEQQAQVNEHEFEHSS